MHIGDLWILANVAHCEIFEFLRIEHIGAIMNFRTYLYYNYKVKVLNLSWGQKNYEILESMKNPSYTRNKKYVNLVEPSRSQIFILFQSPCHKLLPDFHNFSISTSKLATFSYFFSLLDKICQIVILFQSSQMAKKWAQLKKFKNLILKCLIPSEPERAAEARRAVVASIGKSAFIFFPADLEQCSQTL